MKNTDVNYRDALLKLLTTFGVDLPENPSDAQITDAVGKVKKPEATTPENTTLSAEINKRLMALEAGREDSERASLVALASSQGKVIPLTAEQIKTTPLTVLGAIVENTKPTVPLDQRGKAGGTSEQKSKTVTLSAEDKQVCKALHISEEDYLKANPELAATAAV